MLDLHYNQIIVQLLQIIAYQMKQKTIFNFEDEIKHFIPKITMDLDQANEFLDRQDIEPEMVAKCLTNNMPKQIIKKTSKKTTHSSHIETSECILYVFCLSKQQQSHLSLKLLNKQTKGHIQRNLKPLQVKITALKFVYAEDNEICLIVASQCGRLFMYNGFEQSNIEVTSIKITANQITFILQSELKNSLYVLSKIGVIYLVDFKEGNILHQFQCQLPMIEDNNPRLTLDLTGTFLMQVFSYGRIIVWEIPEDIKQKMVFDENYWFMLNNMKEKKFAKKMSKAKVIKKISLKPKMSCVSSVVEGIVWADFIGIFVLVINHKGYMQLLAININQSNNEHEQFFTIISELKICFQNEKYGKDTIKKQKIADIYKMKEEKGVLIAKNFQTLNHGIMKNSQCRVQKYIFRENFQMRKIVVLRFNEVNFVREIHFSQCMNYIVLRNDMQYYMMINDNKKLFNP